MKQAKITSGLEDYMEAISNNIKTNGKVRPIDIARELNVSRASVSEALRRLAELGFITYGRYGVISMTQEGEYAAESVIKRHNLLKIFLCDVLGLDENEAADNACKIEHVISANMIDRFDKFVIFCKNNQKFTSKFLDENK